MMKLRLGVVLCVSIFALFCHQVTADFKDGSAALLYCDTDIHSYNLVSHKNTTLVSRIPRPRVLDYHYKNNVFFWTDYNSNINKASLWQDHAVRTVFTHLSGAFGFAVDWMHDLVYWTNLDNHAIQVARLDGSMAKTLLLEEGVDPRAVALNPEEGIMFWSDYGKVEKIERCNMDGSNRIVIIKEDISVVDSLVMDFGSRRIFWTDQNKNYVSSANWDGSQRRNLLTNLKTPISLDIYGPHVYFVTFASGYQAVYRASKVDGSGKVKLFDGESNLRSLKIYDPKRQSEVGSNVCGDNNGGCSHLCLPTSARTYVCACPNDKDLSRDNFTCLNHDVYLGSAVTLSSSPLPESEDKLPSRKEENAIRNLEKTIGSNTILATIAVIISSISLITMVGITIFFRKFIVKSGQERIYEAIRMDEPKI